MGVSPACGHLAFGIGRRGARGRRRGSSVFGRLDWGGRQDVAQEAGSGVVVDGSCAGLGVQVKTAVLHHEVADDVGSSPTVRTTGSRLRSAEPGATGAAKPRGAGARRAGPRSRPAWAGNPATADAASCASSGSRSAKVSSTSDASGLTRTTTRRPSALSTRAFVI
jgi:hypothetical protein